MPGVCPDKRCLRRRFEGPAQLRRIRGFLVHVYRDAMLAGYPIGRNESRVVRGHIIWRRGGVAMKRAELIRRMPEDHFAQSSHNPSGQKLLQTAWIDIRR